MPTVVHHLFSTDEKHVDEIEESILVAASDLIRDKSIESIAIDDILHKTKVSQASFYKIFNSVDGLFKTLARRLTNELISNCLSHIPETPNIVVRVALKSKIALLILAKSPFLSQVLVKAEWPSSNPDHIMYKDIEKDLMQGIKQGHFSDVSPSIGVNIILGCLRGAARDLLEKKQSELYIDQVLCQILISLGVDSKTADLTTKSLTLEIPPLPTKGLLSTIMSLKNQTKID